MHIVYRTKQIALLGLDWGSYIVGLSLAIATRNGLHTSQIHTQEHLLLFSFVFFFWGILNYIIGLYDFPRITTLRTHIERLGEAALFSLLTAVAFFYFIPAPFITPKTILVLTVLYGYGISALIRFFFLRLTNTELMMERLLFVGYEPEVGELISKLRTTHAKSYSPAVLIDNEQIHPKELESLVTISEKLEDVPALIAAHNINAVVIAPHIKQNPQTLATLYSLLFLHVRVFDLFSFYESVTGRITPSVFSEGWFLEHLGNNDMPIYNKWRLVIDLVSGIVLCIITAFIFLPIALLIKATSRGPILIKQNRVGQGGRIFTIYKFRSMYALAPDGSAEIDGVQFAAKKDKRVTPVGRILRKTRLDELPQAWNLLKRDVTLIGPRPERPEIVKELTEQMPYYRLRHIARPGLTGWAVVHQNYTDTMEKSLQKLQYDLYYIKNRSALLDLSILLKTIGVIIHAKGQ